MSCGATEAFVFAMGMVSGTGTTLTGKILYGIDSVGLDGTEKKFEKPIFQTWLMFAAMILALPVHHAWNYYVHRHLNGKKPPSVPWKTYFYLIIPAAFDMIATFVGNIGLLYVTVSVFQLMKSTIIIFVAIIKSTYLRDRVSGYMWVGICLNTFAVFLVGITSLADADAQTNNTGNPLVGIFFVVLSCLIQSCQYVFEEKIMDDSAPPLIVVGMEGFWGLILTSLIVYPAAYFVPGNDLGSNERFDDAWTMLSNSPLAQAVVVLYLFAILGYNVFAILVTYLLNSIWHAILDNFRPISVWGTDLLLFYVFTHGQFGEVWTKWSWLQFVGMFVLLFGTAVYNGSIRVPGLSYDDLLLQTGTPEARTPRAMQSSVLSKSPLIARPAIRLEEEVQKTPNPADRERLRQEYLTEPHPAENVGIRRMNSSGPTYGAIEP